MPTGLDLKLFKLDNDPQAKAFFPDGLSQHGVNYLSDKRYISHSPATLEDIKESNSQLSEQLIEYTFELVRRSLFPEKPSRLTPIFALKNIEDSKQWEGFDNPEYPVYEIESDSAIELDASFLKAGLTFGCCLSTGSFEQGYEPIPCWEQAVMYWSGKFSDNPKREVLIPLPAKVLRRL